MNTPYLLEILIIMYANNSTLKNDQLKTIQIVMNVIKSFKQVKLAEISIEKKNQIYKISLCRRIGTEI